MEDGDYSVMASWTIDVDTVHNPLVYSVFSEPSIKWRGVMRYLNALLINYQKDLSSLLEINFVWD